MGDLIRCDRGSYEELKKNIKQLHCMSGETEARRLDRSPTHRSQSQQGAESKFNPGRPDC